jgi:hypothetical protein
MGHEMSPFVSTDFKFITPIWYWIIGSNGGTDYIDGGNCANCSRASSVEKE